MKIIEGGVCAAKGFKAGAMRCGIRKSHTKKDLAMILSDCVCNASAVYTTNRVKASPILLTKEHLADGKAQAVIVNSGNANACAPFGMENARRQAKAGARALGVSEENVIVASTGVIGQTLPVEAIEAHAGEMEMKYDNSLVAAEAIMTTDTKVKTIAVEFDVDGTTWFRHDSPEYGNDAVLHHNRLCGQQRDDPQGAVIQCKTYLQPCDC